MSLAALRAVAAVDALNVLALSVGSPRHAAAAASGYAPALAATLLLHADGRRRATARALCLGGLLPNTVGAVLTAGPRRRDRRLSWYVAIGGAVLGAGYLLAIRDGSR